MKIDTKEGFYLYSGIFESDALGYEVMSFNNKSTRAKSALSNHLRPLVHRKIKGERNAKSNENSQRMHIANEYTHKHIHTTRAHTWIHA